MQTRWLKHVISRFVNFEKELRTFGHYSSFCKVVVTSEQGQFLIIYSLDLRHLTSLASPLCVEILGEIYVTLNVLWSVVQSLCSCIQIE